MESPNYKIITDQQGQAYGFGSYAVTIVPHFIVRMRDGTGLGIKVWFPSTGVRDTCFSQSHSFLIYSPAEPEPWRPQPVILEYIPYRKSDGTLIRDHSRHTWLSSHGYVVVRVDMRGSGDSEGLCHGEYLPQEQEDACEVIGWLGGQPWSNGKVGMYGKSWGGFNGLQVAYEQPEDLKAVITLHFTDDRYASDVHYMGGCILANQALWWSAYMHILSAAPPHPSLVADWKALWRQRLEAASEPWAHEWFSHQGRDKFWEHGSVCEDPTRVLCPVLAIGGWNDGYRDAVLRVAETLPTVRGIVGPWSHNWPDVAGPGPAIAFTDECLRWWDYHLKGFDNGAMATPLLRLFIQDGFPPTFDVAVDRQGEWVADHDWPPKEATRWLSMIPDNSSKELLQISDGKDITNTDNTMNFADHAGHGLTCGEWWFISTNSLPGDQRSEDSQSLGWTSSPLPRPLTILGFPQLEVTVTSENSESGVLAVRLCDVSEDGKSNLITYGLLNLTHRDGHAPHQIAPLEVGKPYHVTIKCLSIGYTVPEGHRLRVCVAPSYWPICWPPNKQVRLTVSTGLLESQPGTPQGFKTRLVLPVYPREIPDRLHPRPSFPPARPETAILPTVTLRPASYRRHVENDISSELRTFVVTQDWGRTFLEQTGTVTDSSFTARYAMSGGDPLSARVDIDYHQEHEWPDVDGGIKATVHTVSRLWADEDHFHLHHQMAVKLNDCEFFSREWDKDIKRHLV